MVHSRKKTSAHKKTKAHKFEEFSASSRQHEKQPSLLCVKCTNCQEIPFSDDKIDANITDNEDPDHHAQFVQADQGLIWLSHP